MPNNSQNYIYSRAINWRNSKIKKYFSNVIFEKSTNLHEMIFLYFFIETLLYNVYIVKLVAACVNSTNFMLCFTFGYFL